MSDPIPFSSAIKKRRSRILLWFGYSNAEKPLWKVCVRDWT